MGPDPSGRLNMSEKTKQKCLEKGSPRDFPQKKKNQTLVVKIEERECSGTVHAVTYEVDKSKIDSNHSGLTRA